MRFLVVAISLAIGVWIGRRFRMPSRMRPAPGAGASQSPLRGGLEGDSSVLSTLGRIAHEARSPLGALASSLEVQERALARRDIDPGSPEFRASTRALTTARLALGQLDQIAESLRTAGRILTEQKSLTPARALVDASLLLTAHRLRGGEIERADDAGIQVRVVPGQIVRVLVNLLINADRATADQAPADRATADRAPADQATADRAPADRAPADRATGSAGRIRVSTRRRDGFVEFLVSDSGPGVPDGDEERIFLEGHTRWASGEPGEGYGLAVCREVAREHGGELVLAPSEIGGATLLLRLPDDREPGA